MLPKYSKEMMDSFKNSRRSLLEDDEKKEVSKKKKPSHVPPRNQRGSSNSPYETFLYKFNNLAEYIDDFKTRDLVYYFREIAERSGYKYVISNIKKDMAIMKRLRENYSPREICGMIEFLYKSEQDYLDKNRLSPNLLSSQWVNTIYADMKDWVEDVYVPKSKKKHKNKEWTKPIENDTSEVGGWE